MIERRLQEVELLRKQYGELEHGTSVEWILFKKFKLPLGWDREFTELFVLVPAGYPSTPPDNFFVPVGFKLANGQKIDAYTEPHPHIGRQWGQFSYHIIDGEWRPANNILEGDNLQTFMIKVLDRLKEAN
ncbi:MAG: E2/UBC family protein [Nitrososphaerales archaeon]